MGVFEQFYQVFGKNEENERIFFAPGRVNLIGEHIDYNGGHVLPCALEIGTYLIVRKRKDGKLRFYSQNFQEKGIIEVSLDSLIYDTKQDWANYPIGIFAEIKERYNVTEGMDLYFFGNIPNGAGLSSSASIELVTAYMLNQWYGFHLDRLELVRLSQKVENEFIGVNCGIMDQFTVGFGKKDHAILLNCERLSYDFIPLNLKEASIVIANTNKKRGLADSAYNDRRTTCEKALVKIKTEFTVDQLADLRSEQLEQVKHLLDEEEYKRARHVVTENKRTLKAVEVLKNGDLKAFGQLMKDSHNSLRDDYEVTGKELDALVEAAWKHEGTIGARMTGAGFGGCTVNIVLNDYLDSFLDIVGKEYVNKIGYEASFYVVNAGDGVKELQKEAVLI